MTDEDLASYLMYPRVWLDYARERALYGDPGILPTPVFFYGMEPGQEISVDIERGKTLIVRYLASSEPHEDGTRTVFFELNGQPRSVRVADSEQVAQARRRRARSRRATPTHVGAPMPGTVASVAVVPGRKVARGDAAADARGDEDGDRGARRGRPARSPRCWCAPARRSRRATCWSSSAKRPRPSERILQRHRCVGELVQIRARVRGDQLARGHLVLGGVDAVDGDQLARRAGSRR